MEGIFEESPDEVAKQEACAGLGECRCRNTCLEQKTKRRTGVGIEWWQDVVAEGELHGRTHPEVDGYG